MIIIQVIQTTKYCKPLEEVCSAGHVAQLTFLSYMASEYSNGTRIPTNYWDPIPELDRKDADVEMYFLSANRFLFAENTTDEWYKASRPAYNISRISTEATLQVYLQDEAASPLACAHQEQFCNPNLPEDQRCAPLIGAAGVDAQINAEKLFPESAWPRFEWIYRALVYRAFRAPKIVKTLGSRVLNSKYALFNSVQGPIPDGQWQLDVENWHNATLALLQDAFVSTARGDHDPRWSQWFYDPPDEESKKLCKSQVSLPDSVPLARTDMSVPFRKYAAMHMSRSTYSAFSSFSASVASSCSFQLPSHR